ncbi:MAG: DUF488 domain-containing protein [Paludibaculum sp.]
MQETIFTVGHSTHNLDHFLGLLEAHRVTALCDVRSKPYSRTNPQFNREDLKWVLAEHGIAYVFLGKELGARSEDPDCYEDGKVQYERLARTELFRDGLDRVREGAKRFRIALMCAEKEPLDCHRTILVARHLEGLGLRVAHIHSDGRLETHDDAIERLCRSIGLPNQDMFRTHSDIVEDAYRIRGAQIAYDRSEAAVRAGLPMKRAAG